MTSCEILKKRNVLTLKVPEILHCPEVSSGVRLPLPFIDSLFSFFEILINSTVDSVDMEHLFYE